MQGDYKELIVKKENGVMVITKNRPTKKNAINYAMYEELGKALKEGWWVWFPLLCNRCDKCKKCFSNVLGFHLFQVPKMIQLFWQL